MAAKKKIDTSMGVEALLENGFFYLEKKKWKQSKEYFDKVIEIDPRNSQAHLGLLRVTYKLPFTIDSLVDSSKPFNDNNNNDNYKSALRYGNEEIKSQLKAYEDLYNKQIEDRYQTACDKLSQSQTLEHYKECYDMFHKLGEYKDSKSMAIKAKESIDILEYAYCVDRINDNPSEMEWLQLSKILSKIKYKDSQELAQKCRATYQSLKATQEGNERKEEVYSSACSLYNKANSIKDIRSVKATFESIADYKDSKAWITKCQSQLDSRSLDTMLMIIAGVFVLLFGIIFSNELVTYITTMIICLGGGVFVAWMIKDGKSSRLGRSLLIAAVIGLLLFLLVSAISSGGSSSGSETCDICGGDGFVTQKILGEGSGVQQGFDTYYRCKGCHGAGIK